MMKKLLLALLLWPSIALAQSGLPSHSVPFSKGKGTTGWLSVGPCAANQVLGWASSSSDPSCLASGVPGGLTGNVQYNNGGLLGGLTDIQLTARIQQFSSSLSGVVPATSGLSNSYFLSAAGTWLAPSVSGGIVIGSTAISGGTTGRLLYDNAGVIGETTAPTLTTPVLGTATGTSIALGGCTVTSLSFCGNDAAFGGVNVNSGATHGIALYSGVTTGQAGVIAVGQDTTHQVQLTWNANTTAGAGYGSLNTFAYNRPLVIDSSTLGLQTVSGNPTTIGGGLTVTPFTAGILLSSSAGAITSTTPTCGVMNTTTAVRQGRDIRAVTGTTDTVLNADCGNYVTYSNGSAIASTLPQAGSGGNFIAKWSTVIQNIGAGTVTITPTTSTINGAATLALAANAIAVVISDGTNYKALTAITGVGSGTVTSIATNNGITGGTITTTGTIGLATIATNTLLANATSGTAVPTAFAMPSCATSALNWTTNTGFGCNTVTGTGSVVFSAAPTLTGVPLSPTAAPGTNTTQIATTAFVEAAVTASTSGVATFIGRTGTVVAVAGDYTSALVNTTAPGTSALTRTQLSKNSDVVDSRDFCTAAIIGSATDAGPCLQAAINYAETLGSGAVHVSCGGYTIATTIVISKPIGFFGDGPCTQLISNGAHLISINKTTDIYNSIIRDLALVRAAGAGSGIVVTGTGQYSYSTIANISCYGTFYCIWFNDSTDGVTNWNTITNISTRNNGGFDVDTGIYFKYGTGTGLIISNSHLVTVSNGILFSADANPATTGIGDLTIMGIQHGGAGCGVCGANGSGMYYASRLSISNSQYDAGITTGISLPNYDHVSIIGISMGGGATNNFTGNTSFYCGSLTC